MSTRGREAYFSVAQGDGAVDDPARDGVPLVPRFFPPQNCFVAFFNFCQLPEVTCW
eukprot:m.310320 g.310320  ORF g.310320 m.310320 type:complete len:56 (+) comp15949_c0_seq6:4051-4218(+)